MVRTPSLYLGGLAWVSVFGLGWAGAFRLIPLDKWTVGFFFLSLVIALFCSGQYSTVAGKRGRRPGGGLAVRGPFKTARDDKGGK